MITDSVRKLIAEHIDSVEQLEILILLRHERDRAWTVEQVNNQIRSSLSSVRARLEGLVKGGLLQRSEASYQYRPTSETDAAVGEVARAYAETRFSLIELIFARPADRLKAFAEAFKVSKEKRSDG